MIYGSLCSGIEAASQAFEPLGWKPAFFAEIEKFPSAVLNYHYPEIPNLGDITKIYDKQIFKDASIDLCVAGTPCQSFSLSGKRAGINDPRGNLALEYINIINTKRPKWFIWENVFGVFTSNQGRDFATILNEIQNIGYSFSYRVLDARRFGVAQSRRRVFIVGHIGNDWRGPFQVLFDQENSSRNLTSPENQEENFQSITRDSSIIGKTSKRIASTIKAGYYKCYNDNENINNLIVDEKGIRRLTPLEIERLMGFPDGYTDIPNASDSKRYKALGNSMCIPVVTWIGERINNYENNL